MVEFGEYGFIKWKFKFWNFLSENLKSEFSGIFYGIFWWLFRKVEEVSIFDKVKIWNLNFLRNFLVTIQKGWRGFNLWQPYYEKITNSPYVPFYETGLCSLKKITNSPYVPFYETGLCSLKKITKSPYVSFHETSLYSLK